MYKMEYAPQKSLRSFQPFLLLLTFSLFLLMNACTTIHKKGDGPPPFPVDETRISDAVPKPEARSRSGNKSYSVFGRRYSVMRSSKNYRAIGVASWYGTKFHARNTSSGEPYNMLAMTAAHKSLPLPTYVEVTNLRNKKRVIVKVNDRGPFESNRLIDLSYVAAKKLGMVGHGTALVSVKAIDPIEYAHAQHTNRSSMYAYKQSTTYSHHSLTSQHHDSSHHFVRNESEGVYLQVGAFKNRLYAERLQRRLHGMISSPINIASNKSIYKVQIGPFRDATSASHVSKKLRSIGLSSKSSSTRLNPIG